VDTKSNVRHHFLFLRLHQSPLPLRGSSTPGKAQFAKTDGMNVNHVFSAFTSSAFLIACSNAQISTLKNEKQPVTKAHKIQQHHPPEAETPISMHMPF
jgi:hypothetical protein